MEQTNTSKKKNINLFSQGNQKALFLVNKWKNVIFSYLNACPDKGMNRISTIPANERNHNNGYSNFRFWVNEYYGDTAYVRRYNVRFETGLSCDRTFWISDVKARMLEDADLLIFANESHIYIADPDPHSKKIEWLKEKKYYSQKEVDWLGNNKCKTYNEYNIYGLLNNHQIVSLAYDFNTNGDTIKVITSTDYLVADNKDARTTKPYYDYNIDTSHIESVQWDKKVGKMMYYSFGDRFTRLFAPSTVIALELSELTTLTPQQLYQRIFRVYHKMIETGKAYSTKFPAKSEIIGNIAYNQQWIDRDGNISLYISNDEYFDIWENKVELATADMKEYQKKYQKAYREKTADSKRVYQKVFMYLKRHNYTFNPKWSEEEIEIANNLLTTRMPEGRPLLATEGDK